MESRLQRGFNLRTGDLVLGRKHRRLRHARYPATFGVIRPFARQIQAVTQRQAPSLGPQRQTDRDAAIVCLANLAAVLPRNANRMRAFLRESGVVDDPGTGCATAHQYRENQPGDRRQ